MLQHYCRVQTALLSLLLAIAWCAAQLAVLSKCLLNPVFHVSHIKAALNVSTSERMPGFKSAAPSSYGARNVCCTLAAWNFFQEGWLGFTASLLWRQYVSLPGRIPCALMSTLDHQASGKQAAQRLQRRRHLKQAAQLLQRSTLTKCRPASLAVAELDCDPGWCSALHV
jgi:hypothetical protein